jgi:hypothetical protein
MKVKHAKARNSRRFADEPVLPKSSSATSFTTRLPKVTKRAADFLEMRRLDAAGKERKPTD